MHPTSRLSALFVALLAACSPSGGEGDPDGGPVVDAAPRTDAGRPADAAALDGGAADGFMAAEDLGPAAPECIRGAATWESYTVSDADRSRQVLLPLEEGVEYSTLTVELEVEAGQWQPDCWKRPRRAGCPLSRSCWRSVVAPASARGAT